MMQNVIRFVRVLLLLQVLKVYICIEVDTDSTSLWDIDINKDYNEWKIKEVKRQEHVLSHHYKSLLRDKQIIFIGDSLSRYQYLNLIHYFHTNSWMGSTNQLARETDWGSWKSFHIGSTLRFGCQEICDCYKPDDKKFIKIENRHYYDIDYNITIRLYLWYPPIHPLSVSYNSVRKPLSELIKAQCLAPIEWLNKLNEYNPNITHTFRNDDALLKFVQEIIQPLHTYFLIINNGIWKYPILREDASFRSKFVELAKKSSNHFIWKTTATVCGEKISRDSPIFLNQLQDLNVTIFDTYKYTKDVTAVHDKMNISRQVCYDGLHYNHFVYRELNKLLLRLFVNLIRNVK